LELTNSAMEMEEPTYRERKKKAPKIQSVDGEDAKSIDSEERRLRRSVRKAKKIAKNLEALALAATSDELDDSLKYPVREWTFTIPGMRNEVVSLNPVVAMIAVLCLWGIVLWVSCKWPFDCHLNNTRQRSLTRHP
jgi:hypothetical protein